MRLTFLGTGNAAGVPVYGCHCPACERARVEPEYRRGPCSALLETGEQRILIDAGLTDLTERFPPDSLSRILLTHYHPDHVQGLFHLRWGIDTRIPVFGPDDSEGCADLYKYRGILDYAPPVKALVDIQCGAGKITPVALNHSVPTLGYCFEIGGCKLAYLTDTVGLPDESFDFLQAWHADLVVMDCTHPPSRELPYNHNDLNLALQIHEDLAPRQTWLTHIGHGMDRWLMEHAQSLPDNVHAAHDGVVLDSHSRLAPAREPKD